MRLGTLEMTFSVQCKRCHLEVKGGTLKRAYFWLLLHLQGCDPDPPPLLKTLWGLWRWKP